MDKSVKSNGFLALIGLCAVFFILVLAIAALSAPPFLPSTAFDTAQTNATDENFGKININTALQEELATLPGIGETLAERIVAYREENGSFKDTKELLNVSGIGEAKWEAIRDLICV